MIRLVIIEDQELFRLGIKTAISQEPEMEVCGEAKFGKEGIELVELVNPDIVLVDIGLPDMNGLDVTLLLKKTTECKVIVLSSYSSQEVINKALDYGADSYLLKKTELAVIKDVIIKIYHNQQYIDPAIAKRLITFNRKNVNVKGKTYNQLPTSAEISVLKLIALGHSNQQIAQELSLSVSTIKGYINNLFLKLNAPNRVNLIIKARKLGYLEEIGEE